MENIFDTHAHYDDEAFHKDRDSLIPSLKEKGVVGVVNCAVDLLSSSKTLALSEKYDFFYAALGIHPQEAGSERKGDLDLIAELLESEKKAVAVGEIGLDYHYDDGAPRETQIDLLSRQLAIAKDLDLPVIIHDRDAHEDTLTLLRKYRPKGVVHCFSGSAEMAQEVIKLGLYIGLGGAVTFKNAKKSVEVAMSIPVSSLLLETDAPYMTPVPFRGKRNESAYIEHTAMKIAEVRGMDAQELVNITTENAKAFFRINP